MADTKLIADKQEEVVERNTEEDDLPQEMLKKYSSDLQVQLIKGYRILQVLMYYENNSPFFDKPDNEFYGNKLYYDTIRNPMWCNEIKRKLFNAEYNSLVEVIKDMRLIFENCYYFWGPKTALSEQCVKMERLMEKHILNLPKELKNACSLEETHGKNEDEFVTKMWNRLRNKGKGCSNLMLRTWRKRRLAEAEEYKTKSDLNKFCDCEGQILKWEKDFLHLSDNYNVICSVVQLPQIGQFFHLVHGVLKMKSFCQTEIELMFLMPQYSEAFRRVLSVLLDETIEEMIYDDLIEKLRNIIAEWYEVYDEKNGDDVEASKTVGIEPEFYRIVGESNPLLNVSYEELPYRKKVVMIKSLCDYLVHRRSDVKDVIVAADEKVFTPQTIGRDKLGFGYLFFSTFLDFRLYKQKLIEEESAIKAEYFQGNEDDKATLKKFFSKGSTNFEMIADSLDGLRCLIDDLIYSDVESSKKDTKSNNYEIIESLRELENRVILNEGIYIKRTNKVRVKMFKQWKKVYLKENPDFFNEYELKNINAFQCKVENGNEDMENSEGSAIMNERNFNFSRNGKVDTADKTKTHEFFIKTEIKEEMNTDDSLSSETTTSSTRRRRSSVPTYNMFDNDLFFSDEESESDSPEEIYTEGSDSDDDWDVPKKKTRRTKNKLTKQLKQNAVRKRSFCKSEQFVKIENVTSIAALPEPMVKTEIKIEKEDDSYGMGDEQRDDDKKYGLKIKVVDLAKLKNSNDFVNASGSTSMTHAINQTGIRLPPGALVNAVPIMNSKIGGTRGGAGALSNVRQTFTIVGQPQVISNAYIITTNQKPIQSSPNRFQVQRFGGPVYRTQNVAIARGPQGVGRVPGVVNAGRIIAPNNKVVFINQSPPRFSSVPAKPNIRPSPSVITRPTRFPQVASKNVPNKTNAPVNITPKFGRNITVIPKVNKINDKKNSVKEIEGTIGIHSDNGTMSYVVNLANGTHVPLTNEQVQKLRDGNNGALPLKLKIPVPSDVAEKIEPCVVIDD